MSRSADLLIAFGIWVLTVAVGFAAAPVPLLVALAVPGLVVAPGYALVVALFPGQAGPIFSRSARGVLSSWARLALALPIGLLLFATLGALLASTSVGLTRGALLASSIILGVPIFGLASWRRGIRHVIVGADSAPVRAGAVAKAGVVAAMLAGLALVGALGSTLSTLPVPPAGPTFYILAPDGTDALPRTAHPGDTIAFDLGVVNHDSVQHSYIIRVAIGHVQPDNEISRRDLQNITVDAGPAETVRQSLSVALPTSPGTYVILCELGTTDGGSRSLHVPLVVG